MGEVWRARDVRLGRDVALKLVPDSLAADPDRLARLRREARLLASLNHPNIATLYGIEESGGAPVLVMELVEGETLSARLRRGPLPVAKALELAQQAARALAAAHDTGILHRDFKPANVLVSKTGRVKLLDFGLAKVLDAGIVDDEGADSDRPTLSAKGTREGTVMGTAPYMSPEQARGETVDKRTDVWAFGCVLFEMLSGAVAFPGKGVAETMAAILGREPDWSALPAKTPLGVRRVLDRCLRKEKDERLRDVGDAALELRETDDAGPSPPPPRRRLVPVLAGSLAALAIVGAWLGTRANRQPTPDVARLSVRLGDDERARVALWAEGRVPLAVSPDGRRLAYIAAGERGLPRVYLRELNAYQSKPLAGSDGGRCLFFSADGQWLGFQTYDGTLRKVSIAGGAPIEVGRLPLFSTVEWAPDDRIVFGAGLPTRAWSAPASGGEPRRLGPLEERGHLVPQQLLHGGREMLASSTTPDGSFLEVVSLESGTRTRLVQAVVGTPGARVLPSGHLVYAESGALRAARFDLERLELSSPVVSVLDGVYAQDAWIHFFAVSDTGVLAYVASRDPLPDQLTWVDHAGAPTAVAGGEAPFWLRLRLSPDGRRAAAVLAEGTGRRIWIFDLERGTRRPISHDGETRSPVWSRDGLAVLFQSNRAGSESVLRQLVDESTRASVVLERPARMFPGDITPDGRTIAYEEESPASRLDIWVHTAGAGSSPLVAGAANERSPAFSPDGKWIAYTSDESGRPEVYVQPFPSRGGAMAVSTSGGTVPRWAPDGQTLYYRCERKLMAVPVQTAVALRLGEARALFEGSYRDSFDVSPDGKRFLMLRQADASGITELRIVVNWTEELKRLLP
jgi:Tol biopolymer transport system component